jgi:hypothetical protein
MLMGDNNVVLLILVQRVKYFFFPHSIITQNKIPII